MADFKWTQSEICIWVISYIIVIRYSVGRIGDQDLFALVEDEADDAGLLCHVYRLVFFSPV